METLRKRLVDKQSEQDDDSDVEDLGYADGIAFFQR